MKNLLLSLATVSLLASCDARVNVPPAENHTTVVTPSATEKKTETTTKVSPSGSTVEKSTTTTVK